MMSRPRFSTARLGACGHKLRSGAALHRNEMMSSPTGADVPAVAG